MTDLINTVLIDPEDIQPEGTLIAVETSLTDILTTDQILPDLMMLKASSEYEGLTPVMVGDDPEVISHVMLGSGEVTTIEQYKTGIAPYLALNIDNENYLTLATFCGFPRNGLNDSEYVTVVRRLVSKHLLGSLVILTDNRKAVSLIGSLLHQVTFNEEGTMELSEIGMSVEAAASYNLVESIGQYAEALKAVFDNKDVNIHIYADRSVWAENVVNAEGAAHESLAEMLAEVQAHLTWTKEQAEQPAGKTMATVLGSN